MKNSEGWGYSRQQGPHQYTYIPEQWDDKKVVAGFKESAMFKYELKKHYSLLLTVYVKAWLARAVLEFEQAV